MDTDTIIRAIGNLPPGPRQELLARISGMVVEALADKPKSAAGRPGRKANGAGRSSAARGQGTEEQVLAYVKSNPGQRTEEIGKGVEADPKSALKKLRAAGMVRVKGEKRAMRYWAAGKAAK
jgi:hypothetical protein